MPEDVAKDGFSYGTSADRRSAAAARAVALEGCRTDKDGSRKSQDLCEVYGTFREKCVSVAMNPDAGTSAG